MTNYTVLFFENCERCRQFEPNYKFRNCGFEIIRQEDRTIQVFECSKCKFTWTKEFIYESSSDN